MEQTHALLKGSMSPLLLLVINLKQHVARRWRNPGNWQSNPTPRLGTYQIKR